MLATVTVNFILTPSNHFVSVGAGVAAEAGSDVDAGTVVDTGVVVPQPAVTTGTLFTSPSTVPVDAATHVSPDTPGMPTCSHELSAVRPMITNVCFANTEAALVADQHGALRAYALAMVTRNRTLVSAVAEAAEEIRMDQGSENEPRVMKNAPFQPRWQRL